MSTIAFIPFVRRGLATGITKLESNFEDGDTPDINVQVEVNLSRPTLTTDLRDGNATIQLIGPGDIVGLHTNTIVRVTPPRDDSDAEFNHFPAIEFDQPDLPWRYTPFAADGDRLKPWMVLLVLSETDNEFTYTPATKGQKLPIVSIPVSVPLPDLAQSFAWAHVQFHGALPTSAKDVENVLQTDPSRAVSRIMCPRVLEERKAYRAFLVPAFLQGVQAGLGEDVTGNVTEPAFPQASQPDPIKLPVYYDWRFQTGIIADFQATVRSLVPSPIPQNLATRDMDVSVPGFKLPPAASTGTALPIGGALRPLPPSTPPNPPPPTPPTVSGTFVASLKAFMEASGKALLDPQKSDVLVVPSLYGRYHALQTRLDAPTPTTNPPWFFQLNSDPRNRVGAALGTTLIQKEQQDLMASAWRQLGSLKDANIERRALQVGRETFVSVYQRHLLPGPNELFLMLTGALHSRVANGTNSTIHSLTDGSRIGRQLFDPQFRRFARSRGKVGRSQGRHAGGTGSFLKPVSKLNDPTFEPAPEPPVPDGMATNTDAYADLTPGGITNIDQIFALGSNTLLFWGILLFCVSRRFLAGSPNAGVDWWWLLRVMRFGLGLIRLSNGRTIIDIIRTVQTNTITATQVSQAPPRPGWVAFDEPLATPFPAVSFGTGSTDSTDAANFRRAFGDQVGETNQAGAPTAPVLPQINIDSIFNILQAALHPNVTLIATILKRLKLPAGFVEPADKLEPIMAAPDFPQPVWSGLRDQSPDWILPGLDAIGSNTVGLCVPNQSFIEAFMVGLNHEMSRELLWNEYPTDQRGTYFRQFWDARGSGGASGSQESIVHIHTWPSNANLGTNFPATANPNGTIVLLVRGDVIRRYPNVLVYASQVNTTTNEPVQGTEVFPLFTGRLGTDIYFYGFQLDINVARGNPGRYFVLQEQPSEPRFDPTTTPGQLPGGSYVTVDPNATPLASAASFAIDHYQPPTRVAIHASTLTPPQ
jgi:hypothetical protein